MKPKIRIIVNPVSGSGRRKKALKMIDKYLNREKFEFDLVKTEYHRHAVELTQEAVNEGCKAVIIAGGDGSINEVGATLAGTGVALGIIPAGSGNGLSRSLGIPMNPRKAVENINNFKFRTIDTGLANNTAFMNIAGVGFDAAVSYAFHKQKMRGLFKYFVLGIKLLLSYEMQTYHIVADGREFERKAYQIALANSSQYGNDALVAPKAKVDDGVLNAVVLNPMPFSHMLLNFYRLFQGTLDQSRFIKTFKFKEMTLTQERNDVAHLDGDPFELGKVIEIKINPMSLKVIVPDGKE
ncbi:MAG: diacylglycerol kinase family lipid kinase [Flavobacteriales bacterium]|nr:diacylglycerol kinase family lipid kinase [Flavobacteriales bacterium]MCB9192597.1 diacylglycerol kinase family lipid kinase [Flavobacteriales bacterium]